MDYALITNCSLKQYNTLKLDSTAHLMVFPFNTNGVKEIYEKYSSKKIIIIGKGSNILLSKSYYNEDYVFMSFKLMDNIDYSNNYLNAEAGVSLSNLCWYAVENNIKGYEFLEDVPGSIAGAIIMNAGTYLDNIGQLVEEVTFYDINKKQVLVDKVKTSDFGRRRSKWANTNNVVLSCKLKVELGNYIESLEKILINKKKRYLKQPRNYPNAGSVFKRPSLNGKDYYVWELFEKLNLRGYKKNGAMISEKHPGFIVNTGGAKYEDISFILDLVTKEVKDEFGISLELEWKII